MVEREDFLSVLRDIYLEYFKTVGQPVMLVDTETRETKTIDHIPGRIEVARELREMIVTLEELSVSEFEIRAGMRAKND